MAEKRKMKRGKVEEEKPSKEEYAVAKFLRFNLPPREGKLHGMEVHCFLGNAAVDKLLESKWSASKNAKEPLFTNRMSCVAYLLRLLEKGLFHRAEREKRRKDKDEKDKLKKKKKEKEEKEESTAAEDESRERKGKKDKKGKKELEVSESAEQSVEQKTEAEKKLEKKDEKKKKEKRLRLVMPDQQFFEDSDEVYVWIYDPVNAKNFLIGLLMVLGAIALCMFPLWPSEVRIGVYYISLSAAGFVGFILALVVIRLILFCCVWLMSIGRHHFWFLPNLTEDVGFFDSFKPLYKHDYVPKDDQKATQDSEKKKKKAIKDSSEKKEKLSDKDDSDEFEVIKREDLENGGDEEKDLDEGEEDEEEDAENDANETENTEAQDDDEEENGDSDNEYDDEDKEEKLEATEIKKTK